jgi:hypothetical protein
MLKKYRGRMRFLKIPDIRLDSNDWHSRILNFKSFIRSHSQFQFIDNKIYWESQGALDTFIPLIAVIGAELGKVGEITVEDWEQGPYWTLSLESSFAYTFDLDSLKTQISTILREIPEELGKKFHLVIEEEKIELHFFLQKDYIG